jgi:hypothetical protein
MKVRIIPRVFSRELRPDEVDRVTGGDGSNADQRGDCEAGTFTTAGCSTRQDDADV